MSILKQISKKDPNWLADDDHLDRKDITKAEFDEVCDELKKKYGMKDNSKKESKKDLLK